MAYGPTSGIIPIYQDRVRPDTQRPGNGGPHTGNPESPSLSGENDECFKKIQRQGNRKKYQRNAEREAGIICGCSPSYHRTTVPAHLPDDPSGVDHTRVRRLLRVINHHFSAFPSPNGAVKTCSSGELSDVCLPQPGQEPGIIYKKTAFG
jgi:hypothetical protein